MDPDHSCLCAECGKTFSNRANLKRHINELHNQDQVIKEKFICVLCARQYKRKQDLLLHINVVHLTTWDSSNLYKCDKCSFSSCFKSALKRHNKSKHEGEKAPSSVPIKCTLCYKPLASRSLSRHMRSVHAQNTQANQCSECLFVTTHKTSLIRHIKLMHNKSLETHKCNYCGVMCSHEHALKYHIKKYHSSANKDKKVLKRKCSICSKILYGYSLEVLRSHFEKSHNIPMKWENHTFNSIAEFEVWKKSVEKKTMSMYVLGYAYKSGKVYRCHRSGDYRKQGHNQRKLKIKGSCKINNICPSVMKVSQKENIVSVKYLPTHVGHKNELKHLRLTPEKRKFIAVQLAKEIPRETVLNTIHNSVTNGELQRIHLINKQDITNVEQSFNLNEKSVKHPFDAFSIEAWVTELKSSTDTAVIAYKPQGEIVDDFPYLKEDDFLLIYMSEAQKTMLEKWGQDTVFIDGTQGASNYNFQLYTLLTIDETREGFPAAFMFTNKGDESTLLMFFETIQKITGPIQCDVFMSDMEESFYNAWAKVMGPVNLRLFCTCHVLKAWQKNVNSKIKIQSKREQTKKMLQTILYELDEAAFLKRLEELFKKLRNDNDTMLFCDYFEKQYVLNDQLKSWAYCYRINSGINTNMSLENFNKVLKHCHLRGKKVEMLDKTLRAVLRLFTGEMFDFIIKMKKGKLVRKLQFLRKRHKTSLTLDPSIVTQLEKNVWHVQPSQKSKLYIVKRIKDCHNCLLQCNHCNSCLHEFVCSCLDNTIKYNMCEHIHLVNKVKLTNLQEVNHNVGSPFVVYIDDGLPEVNEVILREISNETNIKQNSCNLDSEKNVLIDKVQQLIKTQISTDAQLKYFEEVINQAAVTIDAMNTESTTLAELLPSGSYIPANTYSING